MSNNQSPGVARVRRFSFPPGEEGRKVIITGIIMLLSARRELLQPGSILHDHILLGKPALIKAARWIQNGLFYFLFGAHAIETPIFAYTRLRPNGIPIFSLVWVKWVLSCFVGGVFVMRHFDALAGKSSA